MNEVKDRISEKYDLMSKGQKKIAACILKNIDQASFFNVKKLASLSEVSEASVIRFCTFLGYKGFPELKHDLQKSTQEQLTIKDRLRISYDAYDDRDLGIIEIFNEEVKRIQKTLDDLDMETFFQVCDSLIEARKIYIVCNRSTVSLGLFFQYYLNIILGNVEIVNNINEHTEVICDIDERDVAVGITFQRYSKMTSTLFEYMSRKNTKMIAITDLPISPIVKYADYCLYADTAMPTYLDSFVAPFSILNAILTHIGRQKNVELEKRISRLDQFWNEFEVFEK
jgi:DNA-binding MurR/RpiR family transcriptional regulator